MGMTKNEEKSKSAKSLQEIKDTRIHTEHPSILNGILKSVPRLEITRSSRNIEKHFQL